MSTAGLAIIPRSGHAINLEEPDESTASHYGSLRRLRRTLESRDPRRVVRRRVTDELRHDAWRRGRFSFYESSRIIARRAPVVSAVQVDTGNWTDQRRRSLIGQKQAATRLNDRLEADSRGLR